MLNKSIHSADILISAVLVFQLIGCGTVLYPERKGQKSGKIDAGVALLDGIGLLFFVVPGVIAFAVDFNNGTIYLPGTSRSSLDGKDIKEVEFVSEDSSLEGIERIVKEQTGVSVKLDEPDVDVTELKSDEDMMKKFGQVIPGPRDGRIAFSG